MQEFVHLRLFSSYSLLKGAIKFPTVAELCLKNDMPAVGISDLNNLFGALEFSITLSGKGIQPIIGAVVTISKDKQITQSNKHKTGELLLIAQNESGYKNLLKIVSDSYLKYGNTETPEFPLSMLEKHSDGIIALTGGEKGILGEDIRKGLNQFEYEKIDAYNFSFSILYYEKTKHDFKYIFNPSNISKERMFKYLYTTIILYKKTNGIL